MHLGNSIICPVTGIPMLIVAGVTAAFAFKKAKENFSKDKILSTVTLTALVFALQMINFTIPTTGSSGHIVGVVLLASLLGPYIAFLSISSILIVQSVLFNDGGLLALGVNIFNMGFLACFIAYPFIFKPLANKKPFLGAILASVTALQLGSIAVVFEGSLSGSIPIPNLLHFTGLMQAIHLPIGIFEGIVCGLIILVAKSVDRNKLSYAFGGTSLVLAGIISNYASNKPDGLEWSLLNISDSVVMQTQGLLYNLFENLQAKISVFANIPYTLGNISGLIVLALIMYFICLILNKKPVLEHE